MSLEYQLRVDDSNELPASSMENWLNAMEHHGIDLTPTTVVEDLFYPVVPRPFLKLDAVELVNETVVPSDSSTSSIESSNSDYSPGSSAVRCKRSFDDLYAGPIPAVPAAAAAVSGVPAAGAAMAGAGILFPAGSPPLTLPSVPSMEEIAQSRPKRRNVKISTDPQSVAARHRRERISDRVRVLQHFVPGGTKMDTASMLDEAIHYVKFLQQQLQKLERLGNCYDARFMNGAGMMMMPQASGASSGAHPFDLNYCSYPTTMMQQSHQQHQQAQNNNNNTSSSSWSPRLCIPDHEQFCH